MTNTPELSFIILDTHSLESFAIADTSKYPVNWNTVSPTIQISVPGNDIVTLDFTPSSIQVYNSSTLGVTCEWCDLSKLPDGIYNIKYSIYPSYKYYIEKTIVRVDQLQAKLDEYYLTLDFTQCSSSVKREDRLALDTVQTFLNGAIAAGNKCDNGTFKSLYKKASTMLEQYINNKACARH